MKIFTSFISKQSGVHIMKIIINEMNACMHIIGKISGERHNYMDTIKNSVLIGRQKILFKYFRMAVKTNITVSIHMVGKNKNIIHIIIRLILVDKQKVAKNPIVHIGTMIMTKDNLQVLVLKLFLEIEE